MLTDVASVCAGRCSDRSICAVGDSNSEPYICAHTLLAAHGAAVIKMRAVAPQTKISINWSSDWVVPYTNSSDDIVSFCSLKQPLINLVQ